MARPEIKQVKKSSVADDLLNNYETPKTKKEKYAVNIVFDGSLEDRIRNKAKENGVGVATYIKMLVNQDLNK